MTDQEAILYVIKEAEEYIGKPISEMSEGEKDEVLIVLKQKGDCLLLGRLYPFDEEEPLFENNVMYQVEYDFHIEDYGSYNLALEVFNSIVEQESDNLKGNLLGSLELNRIYQFDCIEGMKLIPDKSIKVIITDPPYLHEKGGRGKMLTCETLDREQYNMKKLGDFGERDIYNFLNSTKRLMEKPQWYIFCSEKQIFYYLKWCAENKFKHNILTMNKPVSVINRERYSTNLEYIIRIYGNGCALNKLDVSDNGKSWYYSKYKEYKKPKNKLHPSEKPIHILDSFIELTTDEGDIILDPFTGSGSTAESAIKNKRKFIGFEVESKYIEIANKRLDNLELK